MLLSKEAVSRLVDLVVSERDALRVKLAAAEQERDGLRALCGRAHELCDRASWGTATSWAGTKKTET